MVNENRMGPAQTAGEMARDINKWFGTTHEIPENIMGEQLAKDIVDAIFKELDDRGGFDDWWGGIDYETQREIRERLAEIAGERIDALLGHDPRKLRSFGDGPSGNEPEMHS